MPEFELPLWLNLFLMAFCAVVITLSGTRIAVTADRLADRTGLGEALTGAVLLGASTSLPGITTSVTAAWAGYAELALSNAIGGIAAQTAFLGIADLANREANLEHQAASVPNILNGTVLIALLGGVLLAEELPDITVWSIHPVTPLLFVGYLFGLHLARVSHDAPQWKPLKTRLTRTDQPEPSPPEGETLSLLWARFAALAVVMGTAGWVVAWTGTQVAEQTWLGETLVGGLLTAVSTSLPELVTAVAAVRQGALTLAVANIIGGNAFDVMFAVAADVAYRGGSIYHAVAGRTRLLTTLTLVMTAILVMGLVSRQRRGFANIGFESLLILVLYAGGFLLLSLTGGG